MLALRTGSLLPAIEFVLGQFPVAFPCLLLFRTPWLPEYLPMPARHETYQAAPMVAVSSRERFFSLRRRIADDCAKDQPRRAGQRDYRGWRENVIEIARVRVCMC